jgi:hypothetical protein
MANPKTDKLYATYTNITERFFDRWQGVFNAARAGSLDAAELGVAATEAAMDAVDAMSAPWLELLGGTLTFRPVLRRFRFVVDAGKADQKKTTTVRVDPAANLVAQGLVHGIDKSQMFDPQYVDATIGADNQLVITLHDLKKVSKLKAGIYEGNVVDRRGPTPVAKIEIEWPG